MDDHEAYGDNAKVKYKHTQRAFLFNVHNLPVTAKTQGHFDGKTKSLASFADKYKADMLGMVEAGLDPRILPAEQSLYERTRVFHQEVNVEYSHNTTDSPKDPRQYGGCLMIGLSKMKPRAIEAGNDPENLGRWASMLVEGKTTHAIRYVTAYMPHRSHDMTVRKGSGKVYIQQIEHFRRQGTDREPQQALLEDLQEQLIKWDEAGEKVVCYMDANQDVRQGPVADMFASAGYREQITLRHGKTRPPPATQEDNKQGIPIDGIWTNFGHGELRCGFLAFGEGVDTDHRIGFIDIPDHVAWGYNPPHLHRRYPPDVTTQDPRIRRKYNRLVLQRLRRNGTLAKVKLLRSMVRDRGPIDEIRALHHDIGVARRQAGETVSIHLRKKHTGAFPFSPKSKKLLAEAVLWSKVIKLRSGKHMSSRQIRRLMKLCKKWDAFQVSYEVALSRRKEVRKQLRQQRKETDQWRKNHTLKLAEARAAVNDTTVEAEIKQMRNREKSRTKWRKITIIKKKARVSKVLKVWRTVPQTDREGNTACEESGKPLMTRLECTTQKEMEQAIMAENETRYTRCLASVFFGAILFALFGRLFDGPAMKEVAAGTFQPPARLDPFARDFLTEIQLDPVPEEFCTRPTKITAEENSWSWKKRKAGTASEPSRLGFAHHITAAFCMELSEVDAALRSAPYELGFSPEEWQRILDFMLTKSPGVYDLEQMRAISLFVALFNENNKKLGRDTMYHAEQAGALPPEQHGSRKFMCANILALEQVLGFDILRQKRLAAAHVSLDASQCFDRMAHTPTALSMIHHGAPEPAVRSMFETLQLAEHRVATAYGPSQTTYGGKKRILRGEHPQQGAGQGSGTGPCAWVCSASDITRVMRRKGFVALLVAAISLIHLALVCYMFMDDQSSDTVATSPDQKGEDLIDRAQETLDNWVGLLGVSGGKINPGKSNFCLVDFEFKNGKWCYRTKSNMPGDLHAFNLDEELVQLTRLDPDEAAKALGIYLAANGNWSHEIEYLKEKATEYARQIKRSPVDHNEAWLSYTHTIRKTMEYPMPALTLTEDQWDGIFTIINQAALPKSGFVRTFTKDVLYGPRRYQGMGTYHPFFLQELTHLRDFVDHVNRQTTCGIRLQITAEQLRLETGFPGPLTEVDYGTISPHITECWMKTLWKFCHEWDITIEDPFGDLELAREKDVFLVPLFCQKYSGDVLKQLIECRMYLQVTTLADLCTVAGDRLCPMAYSGTRSSHSFRGYQWPRGRPPLSKDHWTLWQSTIQELFCQSGSRDLLLQRPLGRWTIDPTLHWPWFFSPGTGLIYYKQDSIFTTYSTPRPTRGNSTVSVFLPTSTTNSLPPDFKLASITYHPVEGIHLTGTHHGYENSSPDHPSRPTSLTQAVAELHSGDQWSVQEIKCKDEGRSLAAKIIQGEAIAVSDGSSDAGWATSAFIITPRHQKAAKTTPPLTGRNIVPGHINDLHSYRAELGGVMGIVTALTLLCKLHHITQGSIEIGLDGDSALQAVMRDEDPKAHDPSYDLILEIRRKLKALPITVSGRHIQGHMDKTTPYHMLDRWSKLNVDMDGQARELLENTRARSTNNPNIRFGSETVVVRLAGQKLSRIDRDELYLATYGTRTRNRWVNERKQIPAHLFDSIDWDAVEQAFNREPHGKRRWLTKHLCGQMATARVMKRRGAQSHDNCPRCDARDENGSHIMRCPAVSASIAWNEAILDLESWFFNFKTNELLTDVIIARLHEWRAGVSPSQVNGPTALRQAIAAQDALGWENFLLGRPSAQLAAYQAVHYANIHSKRSGKIWVSKLINQLWLVMFKMWEHRNNINKSGLTEQDLRNLQQLQKRARSELGRGPKGMVDTDKHLMSNKEAILQLGPAELTLWLERVVNSRKCAARMRMRVRNELKSARNFMNRWRAGTSYRHARPAPQLQTL